MRQLSSLALALALPWIAVAAQGGELRGPVEVLDGNHLEVDGELVRLAGIRAPEPGTICRMGEREYDCGHIAATALMDLTIAVEVRCQLTGEERNGVPLARCVDPHGFSVNRNMVYTGWALPDGPEGEAFEPVAVDAREAGRGIWRGQDEFPF